MLRIQYLVQHFGNIGGRRVENSAGGRIGSFGERQPHVEVAQARDVIIELDAQFAALQHLSIGRVEDRQHNLAAARPPVDIEDVRVRRRRAVRQHVRPPGVLRPGDHVVRNDVEQEAHPVLPQGGAQPLERRLATQLRVEARGVDDIVAVAAAGTGGEQRRGVEIRDTQPVEVRDEGAGVVELDAGVALQSIGGRGYPHGD